MGQGDAYCPGWFEILSQQGGQATLVLSADHTDPTPDEARDFIIQRQAARILSAEGGDADDDGFGRQLALAAQAFVVRRGSGKNHLSRLSLVPDWAGIP